MCRNLTVVWVLAVMVLFSWGCKESCPICESYVKAVKECVKENAPTATALDDEKAMCLKACAQKEATQDKQKRAEITEMFMKPQTCVLEYEGKGCEAFVTCLKGLGK
ncbi:MAG: hypothetical protein FJ109_01115 [Deltaproteobacteria bacterium]|nr:hypothetical protein [Deltaproteobacteria bacterium]